MGSLLARFLIGALAGLAVWAVFEPFAPHALQAASWENWERSFMLTYCAVIGLVVGGYDGYMRGGKIHLSRGLGLGLLLGGVAGMFGYQVGGRIADTVFGPTVFVSAPLPEQIIARTLVFAIVGLTLGAGVGASSLTLKRVLQGALGGAIGAGIGGACFDVIGSVFGQAILQMQGQTQGEVGQVPRAVAFTLISASIALFIGLVERATRSAWLRLNLGRNEGKEWSIDSPQTFIGRDERASVPLFGDPTVAPIHASIQKQGNQYVLSDAGTPIGTLVNGQRIQQAILFPGAIIQIGSFALQFLMKGTPAPVQAPEAYRGQAYPVAGQPIAAAYPGAMPAAAYPSSQATVAFPNPQSAIRNPQSSQPTIAFQSQQASNPTIQQSMALVALDGPLAGQRFSVPGVMEIGREAIGILLPDPNASRRHASVAPTSGGVRVTDLASTNGTYINGRRIQSEDARPGDVLKIGGSSFRIESS